MPFTLQYKPLIEGEEKIGKSLLRPRNIYRINTYKYIDGTTKTNFSGGIQGGISNGMDIYFRVAFKPVATLIRKQEALSNENIVVEQHGKGRHDPCVLPRAVPIVEAMAAIVITDFYLRNKIYQ